MRFAPDGRYFVAEKYGRLVAFDNINDTTFTIVHQFGDPLWAYHDHGLLGLAVDPEFPTRPYLYVAYTMRGAPGGRLSRIEINPATNQMVGNEVVILEGWCAIFPSHSMGDLNFGPDGSLYMTYGDGGSYGFVDWGQDEPHNADGNVAGPVTCNDPVQEGGAMRSQDFRTTGDPLGWNGTLIRIDPDTGEAMPDNPLIGGDPSDDRILAYGLRNPFRFTIHPTTGDVYICDVGWNSWEEVNKVESPLVGPIPNFGWPCYEGPGPQPSYEGASLPVCTALYNDGSVAAPFYSYQHFTGGSATGIVVYQGGNYPSIYDGALFWADYTQQDIRVMFPDINGNPNPNDVITFADGHVDPVDLQLGPDGDIFFLDITLGAVKRIQYFSSNHPPVAVANADVTSGPSPLMVQFSATASSDVDAGDVLTYAWDFDNDGDFSDSTDIEPLMSFPSSGNYPVSLKVTDSGALFDIDTIIIAVDNGPPVATILEPLSSLTWRVGDEIDFSGEGNDPDSGALPASALNWQFVLLHCATPALNDCHEHTINSAFGQSSGSFTAVEHEWPSYLRVRLTATEPGVSGLSDVETILLEPETVTVNMETVPAGLQTTLYAKSQASPWSRTAIINDVSTITAPTPQIVGDLKYTFASWSDGGLAAHNIHIPATDTTYTATFNTNNRPTINTIGNKVINEGETLQFTISGGDVDGTPPTFSMTGQPWDATLTNHGDGSATFNWSAEYDDAAIFTNVIFTARDAADVTWTATRIISITVNDVNRAPVLASVGNKSVDENAPLQFNVSATDPDGTTPVLSATGVPSGASFTNNGNGTGSFSWTPGFDAQGPYNVMIIATDAASSVITDTEAITITVNNVNRPPVLAAIGGKSVDENALLQFNVSATDPDGNTPTFSASNLPQGASLSNNGNGTATFSWTPSYTNAGSYPNISITASDGQSPPLTDSEAFTITVNNVNRAPAVAPVSPQTVDEDELLQFNVSASDPDGTTPTLSATNLPNGASFTDNGNATGTFSWQPTYDDGGTYPGITIVAADAEAPATTGQTSFAITVIDVDRVPTFEPVSNVTATELDTVEFNVSATDPDGAAVTLAATSLPEGATFTDNGDGTGTFFWPTTYESATGSPYVVGFTADDGSGQGIASCVITVNNLNRPVALNPIGSKSVLEGELLSFTVSATDPDGYMEIEAIDLPPGATWGDINLGAYAFFWTPGLNASENSPYSVTFRATDGETEQSETIQIEVVDVVGPGTITVTRPKSGLNHQLGEGKLKVKWSSTGAIGKKVEIELWRNGALVQKIKNSPNDGNFNWDAPLDTPTGNGYSIVVRSKKNPLISGQSSGTFRISAPAKSGK